MQSRYSLTADLLGRINDMICDPKRPDGLSHAKHVERQAIRSLFTTLRKQKRRPFPQAHQRLGAPTVQGVYVIRDAKGTVVQVGRTTADPRDYGSGFMIISADVRRLHVCISRARETSCETDLLSNTCQCSTTDDGHCLSTS